jgi:hypothetical protein
LAGEHPGRKRQEQRPGLGRAGGARQTPISDAMSLGRPPDIYRDSGRSRGDGDRPAVDKARRSGSQLTHRWSKRDSNSGSPWRGKLLPAEVKGREVDQGGLEKVSPVALRNQWFESFSLQQGSANLVTKSGFKK